jgi:uncharacterized protein YceH (UPF0502 family)
MYSHIQYEYGQQYHADLLRKAAQSRLARSAGKREHRPVNLFFAAAWSALASVSAILAMSAASDRQPQSGELACQIC